jgi:DNA-binding response OmpR family regulator
MYYVHIKAFISRNREAIVNPILKVLDLELDSMARKVRINGKEINLYEIRIWLSWSVIVSCSSIIYYINLSV